MNIQSVVLHEVAITEPDKQTDRQMLLSSKYRFIILQVRKLSHYFLKAYHR